MSRPLVKMLVPVILIGTYACGQTQLSTRGKYALISGAADAEKNRPLIKEVLSNDTNAITGCTGALIKAPLALTDFAYIDIAGNEKSLTAAKSLCDILIDSGRNVGIYQFLSLTSKQPDKEVENVKSAIDASEI